MSNTNELRKQIASILKRSTPNVHYLNFPKPASYPYLVFELKELGTEDGQTKCSLEVNCVAKTQSQVNSLADSVQDSFDHIVVGNNKIFFHAYRNRRDAIVEEDKTIERIRVMIDLYYYSREEN